MSKTGYAHDEAECIFSAPLRGHKSLPLAVVDDSRGTFQRAVRRVFVLLWIILRKKNVLLCFCSAFDYLTSRHGITVNKRHD